MSDLQELQGLLERIRELSVPVPWTGCLLWLGRTSAKGYPLISWRGRDVRVHRVMLAAKLRRTLKPDEFACHQCDVRGCIEPSHLFLGTNQDNVRDKCQKGRRARVWGPRKIRGRREAAAIRRSRAAGIPVRVIADRKGISERHVERICAGTRWAG